VTFYITASLFIVEFTLFYFIILILQDPNSLYNLLIKRLGGTKKITKFLSRLKILENLNQNYSVKMVTISILFHSCYIIQYTILVAAFSGNYNFINYLWAGNLMMFSKSLIPPIFISDIGIREGASIFFLNQFGESASVAFNASIFLFLINVLLPALSGLILLIKKNND
jgi:hypothetical protein